MPGLVDSGQLNSRPAVLGPDGSRGSGLWSDLCLPEHHEPVRAPPVSFHGQVGAGAESQAGREESALLAPFSPTASLSSPWLTGLIYQFSIPILLVLLVTSLGRTPQPLVHMAP